MCDHPIEMFAMEEPTSKVEDSASWRLTAPVLLQLLQLLRTKPMPCIGLHWSGGWSDSGVTIWSMDYSVQVETKWTALVEL